jgi:hypothetical protein
MGDGGLNAQRPVAADDFFAVADRHRIPVPNAFRAEDADWTGFCRSVWLRFPAYGFDRDFVAELAADCLPRVLGQMGFAKLCGRIAGDAKAIVGRGAPFAALPLGGDGRWMLFRLTPPAPELIAFDERGHAWRCPSLGAQGNDLIDLGAWRWGIGEAKAAFRIARLCGRKRPVP